MEFTVDKNTFADCVAWAAKVLPSRPDAPILSGIKIETFEDNTIQVSAFNYEVSAREMITGEVEETGEILVAGKLLADITRSLPGAVVHCKTDGGRLEIKSGNAKYSLQEMPLSDYPKLPIVPESIGSLPADDFKSGIQKVAFAADHTLGNNQSLSGIKLEFLEDQLRLIATDSRRLATFGLPWGGDQLQSEAPVVIKAKTVLDVARNLAPDSDTVEIGLKTDSELDTISFTSGSRITTSRLIDGGYPPNVMSLFADSYPIKVAVGKEALINALKRVALVSANQAVLKFREGEVELEAGQGDEAQAGEVIPCELTGEELNVIVQPAYLLDGLGAIDQSFSSLQFTADLNRIELGGQNSIESEKSGEFRYIFVPIRLR